jgi:hypothetical protein
MKFDHRLISDVVMEDVHAWDRPDFADAQITSASYDGRPMTEDEIDALNEDGDFVNNAAHEFFH